MKCFGLWSIKDIRWTKKNLNNFRLLPIVFVPSVLGCVQSLCLWKPTRHSSINALRQPRNLTSHWTFIQTRSTKGSETWRKFASCLLYFCVFPWDNRPLPVSDWSNSYFCSKWLKYWTINLKSLFRLRLCYTVAILKSV